MGIQIKKLIALLLTISSMIMLFSCEFGTNDPYTEEPLTNAEKIAEKYQTIPFENSFIQYGNIYALGMKTDVITVNSVEEFNQTGLDLEYSEEFFEVKALLFICFTHSSSEKFTELSDLAVKDGVIHPVITINRLGEIVPDDIEKSLIVCELKKSDISASFGDLLVINSFDTSRGSIHHEKFE